MLHVAFAGTFPASLEQPVRRHLTTPCEVIVASETDLATTAGDRRAGDDGADRRDGGGGTPPEARPGPRSWCRPNRPVGIAGGNTSREHLWPRNRHRRICDWGDAWTTCEFSRLDAALRHGDWQSQWAVGAAPPPVWPELAGRMLGILGYGRIGQNIARRARAFDMQVCAIRRDVGRSMEDDLALLGGPDILDKVLERSDYLVVSMPASPETVGWIAEAQLRLMKPSAFLINVARAEIVDEEALYQALTRRSIAGAALDVWYRYPREPGPAAPATRPFNELSNVLMTPHVSGWTDGMLDARARLIAENIRRIASDEVPLNLVAG